MLQEKEIKFLNEIYRALFAFVENDKKKVTTFKNQSKKLFPDENIDKILESNKGLIKNIDYDKVENLLAWVSSTTRSFTQEQKVKDITNRLKSYDKNKQLSGDSSKPKASAGKSEKAIKDILAKKSKEDTEKPKSKKASSYDLKSLSDTIFHLYQFVSKDKKRSKSFLNKFSNLDVDENIIDEIKNKIVDCNEINNFEEYFTIELTEELLAFISNGLRSETQKTKFFELRDTYIIYKKGASEPKVKSEKTETAKVKVEPKTNKKKEVPQKKETKGVIKYPVRKINYHAIVKKEKNGKIITSALEALHKPVNTLRLKADMDTLIKTLLTIENIDNLKQHLIQNESEIFEQYPIGISIEELEALDKFVFPFFKNKTFKENCSVDLMELSLKKNPFEIAIKTREIWLEFLRVICCEKTTKRQDDLIKLFILPNFFEYTDIVLNLVPENTKVVSTRSKDNNISWYMSTKYISITLDNTITNLYFGDEKFMLFKDLIQEVEDNKIEDIEFIKRAKVLLQTESIKEEEFVEELKEFVFLNKDIKIIGNSVVINNYTFSGSAAKDLISLIKIKNMFGLTSIKNFLKNLSLNPSEKAKKELYDFCIHNGLPITPSGTVLLYKWVADNYLDAHSATLLNKPGVIVWQKREKCDLDSNVSCSTGLHLASFGYGKFSKKLLIVEMNPAHCIAVPDSYAKNKLRCTAYKILLEATDFYEDRKYTNRSKDFLPKIYGHYNPNILERQILRYFNNDFDRLNSNIANKKINKDSDVDIFHKVQVETSKYIGITKTFATEIKESPSFTVEVLRAKNVKTSNNISKILDFLSGVTEKIDFNLDDVNYFIANASYDVINLYELILDNMKSNELDDEFKEKFIENPSKYMLNISQKEFKFFMTNWKKLVLDFVSIAYIDTKDFEKTDHFKGSSIVEVRDSKTNLTFSLDNLKKLWNDFKTDKKD